MWFNSFECAMHHIRVYQCVHCGKLTNDNAFDMSKFYKVCTVWVKQPFVVLVFVCASNGLPLHCTPYSALPISRGHFSPNNSRKTPIVRPLGRNMGCLLWVQSLAEVSHSKMLYCVQYRAILHRYISKIYNIPKWYGSTRWYIDADDWVCEL